MTTIRIEHISVGEEWLIVRVNGEEVLNIIDENTEQFGEGGPVFEALVNVLTKAFGKQTGWYGEGDVEYLTWEIPS